MRLMTLLFGILMLASSALCADEKNAPTTKDKNAVAAKESKQDEAAKAKAKSTVKEQNDPFLHKNK